MPEDKKYYITDYESGHNYEVTKKDWEKWIAWHRQLWGSVFTRFKLDSSPISKPVTISTMGGDYESQGENIFFEPDPNFKTFKNHWPKNPITKYFMPTQPKIEDYTPGQREEAIQWFKNNVPKVADLLDSYSGEHPIFNGISDDLIDTYFKLKQSEFKVKPNQFIIGIEYKDQAKVITGEEKVNISFENPHEKGKADMFAKSVLLHIITNQKTE